MRQSPRRGKAKSLGLEANLGVEKLDILSAYDVAYALTWDIDILFSNAGIGEAGPVFEIPMDLVRHNFETNVFAPLNLAQQFIKKFIDGKKKGKIVFTSSMGGLFTPVGFGIYVSTKHALESIAEALQQEVKPYGIQIQTVNPGPYLTGYNETMAVHHSVGWMITKTTERKPRSKQHSMRCLVYLKEDWIQTKLSMQ
ncbi:MAG: SDR family NAD(P)-dependent oxidoreductase [Chitinophagaceae bacterium]